MCVQHVCAVIHKSSLTNHKILQARLVTNYYMLIFFEKYLFTLSKVKFSQLYHTTHL